MKVIKYIAIVVLLIVVAVFVIAGFVPSEFLVIREVKINKPKAEVFEYTKLLKNQENFSVWSKIDLNMKHDFKGVDGSVGFVSAWESENPDVGKGEQEIIAIDEGDRIDYELRFIEPFESTSPAYMIFSSIDSSTTSVQWAFDGEMSYPTNLMLLFVDLEEELGNDLQNGLNNLKEICSKLTIEQRKKTILVFAFDNSEAGLYNILKNTSLKDYTIRSQAFLSFSLIKQSQISVATNIGIQIAAKQGIPIWEVCKQSEYWADKRIATMALSFSRNSKGAFTLGLIGTVNNSQTQVFSFCKAGMSNREAIPKVIFEKFYSSWLSTYYSKEKALPDTLIIYR